MTTILQKAIKIERGDMRAAADAVRDIDAALKTAGNVSGPVSSTDGHVALFDGLTGKRIKGGGALSAFATSTDASNLSGTISADRLPAPGTGTLGGVKRNAGGANQFVTGIDENGALLFDTPSSGGPQFAATNQAGGAQNYTSGDNTVVAFGTELYDTDSCFASNRFTPNVAGYYAVQGVCGFGSSGGTIYRAWLSFYINGSEYARSQEINVGSSYGAAEEYVSGTTVVYLNGSTDYLELVGTALGTGTLTIKSATGIYARFSAQWLHS